MATTTYRNITTLELGSNQYTVANAALENLSRGISGYVGVAVTSANVTLTDTDQDDQAKNIFLDLTGASTGARDVIVPTTPRVYIVRNSTTGGFSHTVKPAAGTGIAVSPAMITLLACDGTNVVQIGAAGAYTDEMAQDAVGGILADSSTIDFTYNDGAPSITGIVIDDSITYAKMQNISAASRLLGRGSASGAGDPEELTATAPLVIASTALTVTAATTSAAGVSELATSAETSAGADTGRTITPDGLAGSIFGTPVIGILVSDPLGTALTTGDGKAYVRIPSTLNGMNLTGVAASVSTVSSSGIPTVQLRRVRGGSPADMLSTKLTVDAGEPDSSTAAAAAVIDAGNDDVATGDQIHIDIDVSGTDAKGLFVEMQFQVP